VSLSRRHSLVALAACQAAGCSPAQVQGFADLAAARAAIGGLASGWRSNGEWNLAQFLNHAAQSVEFSIAGFPQLKPAWFRSTVGSAAFVFFESRGAMSHSLSEPIPGAPALPADAELAQAIARCLKALDVFEAHTGALAPHFAYGILDKAQYTRAHLMHLANHWTQLVRT
jgi:hypothetical protein